MNKVDNFFIFVYFVCFVFYVETRLIASLRKRVQDRKNNAKCSRRNYKNREVLHYTISFRGGGSSLRNIVSVRRFLTTLRFVRNDGRIWLLPCHPSHYGRVIPTEGRNLIKKRLIFIDKGRICLYICVVLMYQHKGVSPEPFEQQPIKFVRIFGYGKKIQKKDSKESFFYLRLFQSFRNVFSKSFANAASLSITIKCFPLNRNKYCKELLDSNPHWISFFK